MIDFFSVDHMKFGVVHLSEPVNS